MFGPLAQTETFGQVWLNVGGKLQRVRTRLGVSDGQQTELIQALDGELKDGTEVVTNVDHRSSAPGANGSRRDGVPWTWRRTAGLPGGGGGNRGGGRGR